MKYNIKLKRKTGDVVKIEIEDTKLTLKDSAPLFAPIETTSVIMALIDVLKREGLEWLRIEEAA